MDRPKSKSREPSFQTCTNSTVYALKEGPGGARPPVRARRSGNGPRSNRRAAGGGRRAGRGLGRGAAPARLRPTVLAPRGAGSRWLPSAPGVRPARASRAGLRPRGGPGGGEGRGAPAGRAGPPRARAGRRGVPSARSARPPPQHLALADSGPRGRDTSRGAEARKEGPGGRRRPRGSRRPGSPAPAGAQERRLAGFPPNPKLFQPTQACSSRVSAAGGAARERLGTHTRPPTRGRRSRGRASGSPRERPLRFPLPLGLQLLYCCGLKKGFKKERWRGAEIHRRIVKATCV
ncbi:collagen alpha-1(I) chain-like [Mustela erminea]|uniref:collagen alpha-1(I) chain-like n=1 Tax=Mustela erminea TaxID=36723 RepID=UPI001386E493|nr:collagen alpha-1(I) chain-like [Mustela erminea]